MAAKKPAPAPASKKPAAKETKPAAPKAAAPAKPAAKAAAKAAPAAKEAKTASAKPVAKATAPAKKAQPAPAPKKETAAKAQAPVPKAKAPAPKAAPAKPVAKAAPEKPAPAKKVAEPAKPAQKETKPAPAAPVKKAAPAKAEAPAPAPEPAPAPVVAAPAPAPMPEAKPQKVRKKKEPQKKIIKQMPQRAARPEVRKPVEMGPPPIVAYKAPEPKKARPEQVKEVKVPKTSVKTTVEYEPGYVPLDRRVESPKSSEPLVRYSDNDLNEFREMINRKLDSARRELAYLQGMITRKDDMSGDDSDSRQMTMEDGGITMERENVSLMATRQVDFIDKLEKALIRIENKTYGICRETGKLIDKNRLRAVPHATLSMEAKLGLNKIK